MAVTGESPPSMNVPQQSSAPAPDNAPEPSTTYVSTTRVPTNSEPQPSVFSKDRYSHLFNVDEKMLLKRMFKALFCCGGAFYGQDRSDPNNVPDLYGPFWITTTIILIMGILGSVQQNNGALDINKISYAAITFYVGLTIPPFILYWFLRWFHARRSLTNVISLYGYSFFIYIPMAICTLIPVELIGWITIAISFGVSTMFIVKNVYCYFLEQQAINYQEYSNSEGDAVAAPTDQQMPNQAFRPSKLIGLILMIGVIGVHFVIALVSFLIFFHYEKVTTPETFIMQSVEAVDISAAASIASTPVARFVEYLLPTKL